MQSRVQSSRIHDVHHFFGFVFGHPALVHHLLRRVQEVQDLPVVRPLAEVVMGVVAEGVDDTPQHPVLQEGRNVLLRVVVRRQNLVLKLGVPAE